MNLHKQFLISSILALGLGFSSVSSATIIYSNDFESGSASGFTGFNTDFHRPLTARKAIT